jgi:hypothetical protein
MKSKIVVSALLLCGLSLVVASVSLSGVRSDSARAQVSRTVANLGTKSHMSASRSADTSQCQATAWTPTPSGGSTFYDGVAESNCDQDCSTSCLWVPVVVQVSLRNHAGSTLDSFQMTCDESDLSSGSCIPGGAAHGCSGAIVHTFVFVNANGSVSSDTSAENQC